MRVMDSAESRPPAIAALAVLLLVVAGCAQLPRTTPATTTSAPPRLLSAGPLELPSGCEPVRAAVYRTHFVVETDGRVSEARPDAGDGCVEQALLEWVATFRYEALETRTPIAFDWIAVTAQRG